MVELGGPALTVSLAYKAPPPRVRTADRTSNRSGLYLHPVTFQDAAAPYHASGLVPWPETADRNELRVVRFPVANRTNIR